MKLLVFLSALIAVGFAASLKSASNTNELPRLTDNRIVGGSTTNIVLHKHQVSLIRKGLLTPSSPYTHNCGGSIYSKNIVITAAHCIIAMVPSQLKVVAGSTLVNTNDGYIVPVKEIVMHEKYNSDEAVNDIAILVLAAPLPINNFTVGAIALTDGVPRAGSMAVVTGWGATSQGGPAAKELQSVELPIVSNELCNEDYGGVITDDMLCAGYRGVGGKDSCQGDSGGPLVVNGRLTGIVSWGYGCADPKYPGVYVNVSHFKSWLLEKIALYQDQD